MVSKSSKQTGVNQPTENKGDPKLKGSSTAENQPTLNEALRPSGWRAAVEAIEISGVTKTLAMNCEMRSIDEDNSVVLILDESRSSLLSEEHVRKNYFGVKRVLLAGL